jgi:hypothetical protein
MKKPQREKRRYGVSWGVWVTVVASVVGAPFVGCDSDTHTASSRGGSGGEGHSSSSSSIGSSSSSGSSSGGGGGGGGGGVVCTGDADCIGFSDCFGVGVACNCIRVSCVQGYCAPVEPLPTGSLAKKQIEGDCKTAICDGKGSTMNVEDPTDAAMDDDDCTDDVCSMGITEHPPSAEGTPCGLGLCDGQGLCIQCIDTTQCSNGTICLASICMVPTCNNGIQDGDESDVDCGSSCIGCAPGKQCTKNTDCQNGSCLVDVCN